MKKYISEQDILSRISELAERISEEYREKQENTVILCLLKGSLYFCADLTRMLSVDIQVEYIQASSYIDSLSSGSVKINSIKPQLVKNKNILIIEDIVDTGLTISRVFKELLAYKPCSVKVCTLLDKPCRRKIDVEVAYKGFSIEDFFVVGYGMDYNEKYRNLPYIGILE